MNGDEANPGPPVEARAGQIARRTFLLLQRDVANCHLPLDRIHTEKPLT
jgi:hypothetical protein